MNVPQIKAFMNDSWTFMLFMLADANLINVSLMILLTVNQRVSTHSKSGGGQGALMLPMTVACRCSTNAPALTGTPS